ncbi:hypothetical protein ILYODFUR_001785 [Ilyodon furcidens]|uniref:Uncharacterized protein n=1 Tax=Ilyodon furcidens TaxID=33524 RepID=A0ABV0STI0_9TELE
MCTCKCIFKGKNACQWKRCQRPGTMLRAHQYPFERYLTSPSTTDKEVVTNSTAANVFQHTYKIFISTSLQQPSSICDTKTHCGEQRCRLFTMVFSFFKVGK